MNTAYHLFNAKMVRYFTRKQQFTNLIAGQDIYQTPVDAVRVLGITVSVNNNYEPTVKEVRSEYEWRQMKSYKTFKTTWPSHYFTLGADAIQLYPTPSQNYTNGLRFYYQPQDHDLSLDDITSVTTGATVSVTQNSAIVTATSGIFTSNMIGLSFQITGIADLTWYEITAVQDSSHLTLKSAYVSPTASSLAWRIGQTMIFPQEYQDAPVNYALYLYFASKGNSTRSQFHKNLYDLALTDALEEYSSANESSVIDEDGTELINPWQVTPIPGNS